MRILVCNGFSDFNRGGAAITSLTIRTLKETFPGSAVSVIAVAGCDPHGDFPFTREAHPDARILPSLWRPTGRVLAGTRAVLRVLAGLVHPRVAERCLNSDVVKHVRMADLVVSKGGFVFVDRRRLRQAFAMFLTVSPLLLAQRCGVATAIFPTSVGPFTRRMPRLLARISIGGAFFAAARDPISLREAVETLRVNDVREYPDIVFAHERIERTREFGSGRVAVAPRAGNGDYVSELAGAMRELATRALATSFVIVDQGGDREVARRLSAETQDLHSEVALDLGPEELMNLYASCDLLLTSRLHGAIFAALSGTPAVAESRDGVKTEGVYETLGVSGLVIGSGPGKEAWLAASERALTSLSAISGELLSSTERLRRRLDQMRSDLRIALSPTRVPETS